MSSTITQSTVSHIATLANIPASDAEITALTQAFAETLDVVANLQEVSVDTLEPTHQVTGMQNVWRDDNPIQERSFTQEEALQNAARSHNGYVVVARVLDQDGE